MIAVSAAAPAGSAATSQSRTPVPRWLTFPRLGSCDQATTSIHGIGAQHRAQVAEPRHAVGVGRVGLGQHHRLAERRPQPAQPRREALHGIGLDAAEVDHRRADGVDVATPRPVRAQPPPPGPLGLVEVRVHRPHEAHVARARDSEDAHDPPPREHVVAGPAAPRVPVAVHLVPEAQVHDAVEAREAAREAQDVAVLRPARDVHVAVPRLRGGLPCRPVRGGHRRPRLPRDERAPDADPRRLGEEAIDRPAARERLELGHQLRRGADAAGPVVDVPRIDVDAERASRLAGRARPWELDGARLARHVQRPLGGQRERDEQCRGDATGEQIQGERSHGAAPSSVRLASTTTGAAWSRRPGSGSGPSGR